MAAQADPEVKAMQTITKQLGALDEPARNRVVAWMVAKFGAETPLNGAGNYRNPAQNYPETQQNPGQNYAETQQNPERRGVFGRR